MLIGDLIISARELYPDLPATLPTPVMAAATVIQATVAGGAVLSPGTYYVKVTLLTPYGETLPSNELSIIIVGPNNSLTVTDIEIGGLTRTFPIVTGINVYVGTATNQQTIQYSLPTTNGVAGTLPITLQPTTPATFQAPPTRSTAFLPDSNGRMISAGTIYRWINEALNVASYVCKGIPDTSGLQMKSGQGMYVMPGIWDKFENCWYDGYPVAFDARSGAFYRNVLSGITFIGILQTNADRQIMEFQPQPSRSGGTTTLSAGIGISDSVIPLTSIGNIGLALGLVMVGTEVISYSTLSGGNLTGCIRGLGGTQQSAWPIGTIVNELNFRFGGLRLNQQVQYQPGQSLLTLQVPPGWAPPLVDYLVGRFREAEQNFQAKGESIKSFTSFLKDYNRGTKQVAGPRQLGGAGTGAGDGYPSASSGGRLIIP